MTRGSKIYPWWMSQGNTLSSQIFLDSHHFFHIRTPPMKHAMYILIVGGESHIVRYFAFRLKN